MKSEKTEIWSSVDLIVLLVYSEELQIIELATQFSQPSAIISRVSEPNILNATFSNNSNTRSSLHVRYQVPHLYKITGKITHFYIF